MANALPSVRISGHIHITLETGDDLTVDLGSQRAIDLVKLTDTDLDFLTDLLHMIAEHARLLRKRYQAID